MPRTPHIAASKMIPNLSRIASPRSAMQDRYDLYDLYSLYDLALVAGWEPHNMCSARSRT